MPPRTTRRASSAAVMPARIGHHAFGLPFDIVPDSLRRAVGRRSREIAGAAMMGASIAALVALASWNAGDPSLSNATGGVVHNLLGRPGAIIADLLMQLFGLAALAVVLPPLVSGWRLFTHRPLRRENLRLWAWALGVLGLCAVLGVLPVLGGWPINTGLGGVMGDLFLRAAGLASGGIAALDTIIVGTLGAIATLFGLMRTLRGSSTEDIAEALAEPDEDDGPEEQHGAAISLGAITHTFLSLKARLLRNGGGAAGNGIGAFAREMVASERSLSTDGRTEPSLRAAADVAPAPDAAEEATPAPARAGGRRGGPRRRSGYAHPALDLLAAPPPTKTPAATPEMLAETGRQLMATLQDFGVRGEIGQIHPGPVVTLYELEPAPGIKSSRVIGLADDIARSMSAVSARVAVVPGRNVIGIELPNQRRDKVLLRELLATRDFGDSGHKLAIALGKTIGGDPVIVDLARMPHLLVAGTTGSGKSVAINTMILSLLYRMKPEECRLIMIDPKMLELSVYDGIPHLLAPVVTDPKKAVVALKWAVREMEDRYKKMSKLGVRNIDGFNARVRDANERGESLARTVQTGFDHDTGEAIYEREEMDLKALPYIVVVVDEMADLMMVAGKEIEGAIQRLAQMARAAGIHLVMATQRPSVDVITGTIKANFPTRISFQVTGRIDSRTILGEMGAEQLLGQGDMLYMAGGGRISRVHGPFVADDEVEKVVVHLKAQGAPDYVDAVTADLDDEGGSDGAVFDKGGFGAEGGDLFDQAVAVVMRDRKCSTSYIQRRLQIGYNRAASLVERMEKEGLVGAPNHAGKREILMPEEAAE